MWGHLAPLWPFAPPEGNNEGSGPALPPLELPGSVGREDLLRPLSRACPNCRKRRWKTGAAVSPKGKNGCDGPQLCDVCRSIQAVSKFVPRKDFWNFADVNETSGGEWLRLSVPKTASRLVHVHTSGGERRRFNDTTKGAAQVVEVADGDIISLLWSGGATYSSSSLKPMAQFRVVRIREGDVAENDLGNSAGDDQVDASPPKEAEGDGKESDSSDEPNGIVVDRSDADGGDKETSLAAPQETVDNDDASMNNAEPTCNAGDADDDAKGEKMEEILTQPKAIVGKQDDASSSSSSDDEHLWNVGGFLKAKTLEEKVARGNYFRDVRAKYGDNRRVGEKRQRPSQQSNCSSKAPRQTLAKGKEDTCAGSVGGGSKTEEESESAPLTLPSQFLASYSKSFDSMEKTPSQPVKGSEQQRKASTNLDTPQKSNQGRKRSHNEMDTEDEAKDTTTPKKSNVSGSTANSNSSVLISSLSYDQLVQIRKESAPKDTDEHPSVRHSVLSLTLALTSNASSWDATFLRECNADGDRKDMAKPGNGDAAQQNAGQRWMPRLLQGTQVKTMHGEPNNTAQAKQIHD
ncbi:hypothetical protein ACHAXT_013159 [Thalassiosira profunda]